MCKREAAGFLQGLICFYSKPSSAEISTSLHQTCGRDLLLCLLVNIRASALLTAVLAGSSLSLQVASLYILQGCSTSPYLTHNSFLLMPWPFLHAFSLVPAKQGGSAIILASVALCCIMGESPNFAQVSTL